MIRNITIHAGDLPAPGEDVLLTLGAYEVLITNTGAPIEDVALPEDVITYTVVDVAGSTRTHAASVRRRAVRSRVDRFTLCSRSDSRRVDRRRNDLPLTVVTCTQCRARLESEGEI